MASTHVTSLSLLSPLLLVDNPLLLTLGTSCRVESHTILLLRGHILHVLTLWKPFFLCSCGRCTVLQRVASQHILHAQVSALAKRIDPRDPLDP